MLEAGVVALSLLRAVVAPPGRLRSRPLPDLRDRHREGIALLRVASTLVLIEVLYFKFFVWGDLTAVGGLVLGAIAAGVECRMDGRARRSSAPP